VDGSTEFRLPPRPPIPAALVGVMFILGGGRRFSSLHRRYGDAFVIKMPGIGTAVAISDPALVKQMFTAPADVLYGGEDSPLRPILGENSSFSLDEDRHLRQRRLLLPPFHGARMAGYATIFEQETVREIASWPMDEDFPTLQPMMRITLNAILRAVFGAEDDELDGLRNLLPAFVKLGSFLTAVPALHRDLGSISPWSRFKRMRRTYDGLIDGLIEKGRRCSNLDERSDVLSMLLQARYDDGTSMHRDEIADQLLSLLVAGHETTAATLAWAIERLRRHPVLLGRLVDEVQRGESELREATIWEVQRMRPVINGTARNVKKPFELGKWLVPPGMLVFVDATSMHYDPRLFPDPLRFSPDRFVGAKPDTYSWVPFGGGRRRCIGAAFAQMEMDVVLRTLLAQLELVPTTERGERWRFRGVAFAPARGGVARVRRRRVPIHAPSVESPARAGIAAASVAV
jgi:cytochrome P450